ncbi:hypothetical protein PENSPDRAFT_736883 [Peniophora sp. CONT]|nr:hypothetical protein PENSPDRAFT_736883 [Peniophora sp. CONT]
MADTAMFMTTFLIADEEDAYMRKMSSTATVRHFPRTIDLILPGGTKHTVRTPDSYEAAIDLAYETFPDDLHDVHRQDISFAFARIQGKRIMLQAPFDSHSHTTWSDRLSQLKRDQCIQVVIRGRTSPPSSARQAPRSSARVMSSRDPEKGLGDHSSLVSKRKGGKSWFKFD